MSDDVSDERPDDEADDVPRARGADPADAVMDALRRIAKPAGPEEIAAATGLSEATVRRTLGRLASQRIAARAGGGKFTVARKRTAGGTG